MKTSLIGRETLLVLRLSTPIAFAEASGVVGLLIELSIVAQLGVISFAAFGLAGNIISNFLATSAAFTSIFAVLISTCRHDSRHLRHTYRVAGLFSTGLAIVVGLLTLNLQVLFELAGQAQEVTSAVSDYVVYMAFGVVLSVLAGWQRACLTGLGVTLPILYVSLVSIPVGAAASACLVLGLFGLPEMGLAGAGLSFILVSFFKFSAFLLLWRYEIAGCCFNCEDTPPHQLPPTEFWHVLRFGSLQASATASELAMFSVAALVIGSLSEAALAAHVAVITLLDVFYVVPFAIGEIGAVRTSERLGSARRDELLVTILACVGMCLATSMVAVLIILAVRDDLARFFFPGVGHADGNYHLFVDMVLIAALFQIGDALQTVARRLLRGLQDSAVPFAIALIGYWVIGVGVGSLLAFAGLGPLGIWWGLAAGLCFSALLMLFRLKGLADA